MQVAYLTPADAPLATVLPALPGWLTDAQPAITSTPDIIANAMNNSRGRARDSFLPDVLRYVAAEVISGVRGFCEWLQVGQTTRRQLRAVGLCGLGRWRSGI